MSTLLQIDPTLASLIDEEAQRQATGLELIASENYTSRAVREATGSVLTNKYSEGYPGKRYYGGNQVVDKVESLAIERAKTLFKAEHANVQSHAGSQANLAVYLALCQPGDKILGMDLAQGGHLTHGSPVNISGKWFQIVSYGVEPETHRINMDHVREIALREKPKVILAGFTAYPRTLDFAKFAEIAQEVGAYLWVDMAHIAGLVAGGVIQSPIPFADVVSSTTHKTLRGPRGAFIVSKLNDRLDPTGKKNLAQKIDSAVFPGMQGGPLEHVIAAKAVAFLEASQPSFASYQQQVLKNAAAMAQTFLERGGTLVSGGTENHLLILDVSPWGFGGKEAEQWLENAGLSTNRNLVPFDQRKPLDPSGLRIGTPAITTRGFTEDATRELTNLMCDLLIAKNEAAVAAKVSGRVKELAAAFPIPE